MPLIAELPGDVSKGQMSHFAYVTFLTGNGDYVKGVVGLAKSLKEVKSLYPLVVAVGKDVPQEHRSLLRSHGCLIREVEPIYPPEGHDVKFAMKYYVVNYTKLRIWEFDNFTWMVYLDADMLVARNIDELFFQPVGSFRAVLDCFCESTWSHSPQYKIGYCQQVPHKVKWTLNEPQPAPYFNAGMFVFEPSKATFAKMMQMLKSTLPTPFAEQDFLNKYFEKVFKPLSQEYNLVMAMLWRHPENINVAEVKVIHYCAEGSKPWRFNPNAEHMDIPVVRDLVDKWWKVYYSSLRSDSSESVVFSDSSDSVVFF